MMLRFAAAGLVLLGLAAEPVLAQSGSTATGTSNALNPALSLNSLFMAGFTDPASDEDGIKIQEVELSASSVVDPYFKAWGSLVFEPGSGDAEAAVAVEEAWVSLLGLPQGFGAKAGRFKLPMGRHSQLHTHQFPFIQPPRAFVVTLGEEGPTDVGVMPTYSPDLPWYMNLTAYVTDGANELFDGESRALAAGGRVDNLWDLTEATTFEAAASVLNGPAPLNGGTSEQLKTGLAATSGDEAERRTFYGADVRIKWKDVRKTYGHALQWITEVLVDHVPEREDVRGAYTTFEYRVARQWWAGAGYSWDSLVPEGSAHRLSENEFKAQLAWVPSEFSEVRTNVSWLDPEGGDGEFKVQLQLNFTIGAHPAHSY